MVGIILLEDADVALSTRDVYAPAPRIVIEVVGILHARERTQQFAVAGIEHDHPCRTPRCHKQTMMRLIQSHWKVGLKSQSPPCNGVRFPIDDRDLLQVGEIHEDVRAR